jgi:predicted kinase
MTALKPTLNILIGVAGSGKSVVTKTIRRSWLHRSFDIISPDKFREKLCDGNRSDQSKNKEVWDLAYLSTEASISARNNIIFDSTMLTPKNRKKLIKMGQDAGYHIIAHAVEKDLDTILRQNKNREWPVPEDIVRKMYDRYTAPSFKEGFDRILYYREDIVN